ncbi:MAG: hypothetical protein WAW41_10215 [Methylobacter sp.]
MPAPLNNTQKSTLKESLSIRHSPEVKAFVDNKAAENNELPSAFCRRIFNAGLEQMFQIKIINNQIINPPPPH